MVGTKEGKFLKFTLDNGRTVKYDLSTGQSIGIKGNPVNSTNHVFHGMSIMSVLDTLNDENYKRFLKFVKSKNRRIASFGSLLVKAKEYRKYEQLFSSGLNISSYFRFPDSVTPNVIKFAKKYNICLDDKICENYKKNTDFANLLFSMECISLNNVKKSEILSSDYYYERVQALIDDKKYGYKSLIKYIDDIMTYEALSVGDVIVNLYDYVRMMSYISNKYDKYPRNLLTSHQIAIRNYNRMKKQYEENKFKEMVDESFEWKYKSYLIMVPKCTQDIKDEAVQQNNCVASYIDDVMNGLCKIVFLRKADKPEKSLVTVEIRDNKVVQSRRAYNMPISSEEFDVLKEYEEYLNKKSEE